MRKSSRRSAVITADPKMEMTPMIDMVFLLLVFFIIAAKPIDLFSGFKTTRVAPAVTPPPPSPPPLFTIIVQPDNTMVLNGKPVSPAELSASLARLATYSTQGDIILKCADASAHGGMIQAMDICAANGFSNLTVASF